MQLVTIGLMSVGLAADAFAVSLTSGFLIKRIKVNKALKIALFFGIFQTLMPLLGWVTGLGFRELVSAIAHWIAFTLLAWLGGNMIYEALTGDEEKPFNPLDNSTLFGLAIATSLDALAAGLGISVIKMPLVITVSIIGLITFLLCFLGVFMGHRFGNLLSEKVEVIGGLILIGIGSKILIENLLPIS
ncbi:manganese efflux pump MntP [Dactylococcopsis salina]|uniref:Putative manganese efflux pump MntP n=1 Tax=Dactylococcopsis salina (strain PCC 8305) TaxID=13035 RepID=K9YVR0_DACS8|nr:manganese efflux pump MntP family protein [Dactylococcopsis salina]AFZ50984.1 putative membrane protein [Dactylococcopsis salina PCC 8305]